MLRRLQRLFGFESRLAQRERLRRARPAVEWLEDRTLPSAMPYALPADATQLAADFSYANSNPGSYTINLPSSTTYSLTTTSATDSLTGSLLSVAPHVSLSVVGSTDDIITQFVTNPSSGNRLLEVQSGGSLTLSNLTLTGGRAQGSETAAEGGAILSWGALTLTAVTISNNTAQAQGSTGSHGNGNSAAGGGIYVNGGSVTLTSCVIESNKAQGATGGTVSIGTGLKHHGYGGSAQGGGLFVNNGTVTLTNDTIQSNVAAGGLGGQGGGNGPVFVGDTPQSGFGGTGQGGGIYIAGGSVTGSGAAFSKDSAQGGQGSSGRIAYQHIAANGSGGGAAYGGGIYVAGGSLTLGNSNLGLESALGGAGGKGASLVTTGVGGGGGSGGGGGATGGGLYVGSAAVAVTLSDDTIWQCSAVGGAGAHGGHISASEAGIGGAGGTGGNGQGGGMFAAGGTLRLVYDTLGQDTAQGGAGGTGGTGGVGNLIGNNIGGSGGGGGSGQGGGLYLSLSGSASASFVNDTVAANLAQSAPGAPGGNGSNIFTSGGPDGANGSAQGGGLYIAGGTVALANTLLDADQLSGPNQGWVDVYGSATSSDHDLVGTPPAQGFGGPNSGDILNAVNVLNLANLPAPGSPLQTIPLKAKSPALNAGDINALASATDERGYSSVVNGHVDIGAYETGAADASALSVTSKAEGTVSAGGTIVYTITVSNTGSATQGNITLFDPLPVNTTLASWPAPSGWRILAPAAGNSGNVAAYSTTGLAAGKSVTFTLTVNVNASAPICAITNTVTIGPVAGQPKPSTCTATSTTVVNVANCPSAAGLVSDLAFISQNPLSYTITLTAATGSPYGLTSPLSALVSGDGLTVIGNGDTIERLATGGPITPAPAFRLFTVNSGASLTLENLTLSGGLVQGSSAQPAEGGAIYSAGTLTLNGVTVSGNTAQGVNGSGQSTDADGGGVYVAKGKATFVKSIVKGNNATVSGNLNGAAVSGNGLGGGIYVAAGTVAMTSGTALTNHAQGGGKVGLGAGGGLYVAGGTVTLVGDLFGGNMAAGANAASTGVEPGEGHGGALDVTGGTVTLTNDRLDSNIAQGGSGAAGPTAFAGGGAASGVGGALAVEPATSTTSVTVTLSNDTISSNGAKGGSGGRGGNATQTTNNGSRVGNGGGGGVGAGGGLYVVGGNVTLAADFVHGNYAAGGAGGAAGSPLWSGSQGVGGNGGTGSGGGLYVDRGTVTLTGDWLNSNNAHGGQGGSGSPSNTPRTRNTGGNPPGYGNSGGTGGIASGGALQANAGTVTLTGDTLSSDSATGGTGGNSGAPFLESNGQPAHGFLGYGGNAQGGGLVSDGSTLILVATDDTLAQCTADGGSEGNGGGSATLPGNAQGGGLALLNGRVTLTSDTVADNQAQPGPAPTQAGAVTGSAAGGGMYVSGGGVALTNTLVAANTLTAGSFAGTGPDIDAVVSLTSTDSDLVGNGTASGLTNGHNGDQVGGLNGAAVLNPGLDPNGLQSNGGPSVGLTAHPQALPTLAVETGSPAIKNGDVLALTGATDERGYSRTLSGHPDVGAYESGATPATGDLAVNGTAAYGAVAGGKIIYTFTVTNNSTTAQSNVDLVDVLLANTTLVSWATSATGWTLGSPTAGTRATVSAWSSSLAAGAKATFTLELQVKSGTTAGTVISNTASVGPVTGDPQPGNNSATFSTTVGTPVAGSSSSISVTRGSITSPKSGEFMQTLTLKNSGTKTLTGPLAVELASLSAPKGTLTLANAVGYSGSTPYVEALGPGQSLAPGKSVTVTLVLTDSQLTTASGIGYSTTEWLDL